MNNSKDQYNNTTEISSIQETTNNFGNLVFWKHYKRTNQHGLRIIQQLKFGEISLVAKK